MAASGRAPPNVKQRESLNGWQQIAGLLLGASPVHLVALGKKCAILNREPPCGFAMLHSP
jgi:hypothetical protein